MCWIPDGTPNDSFEDLLNVVGFLPLPLFHRWQRSKEAGKEGKLYFYLFRWLPQTMGLGCAVWYMMASVLRSSALLHQCCTIPPGFVQDMCHPDFGSAREWLLSGGPQRSGPTLRLLLWPHHRLPTETGTVYGSSWPSGPLSLIFKGHHVHYRMRDLCNSIIWTVWHSLKLEMGEWVSWWVQLFPELSITDLQSGWFKIDVFRWHYGK